MNSDERSYWTIFLCDRKGREERTRLEGKVQYEPSTPVSNLAGKHYTNEDANPNMHPEGYGNI